VRGHALLENALAAAVTSRCRDPHDYAKNRQIQAFVTLCARNGRNAGVVVGVDVSRWRRVVWSLISIAVGLRCLPAFAEDDFAASLKLRGGYDTNPEFSTYSGIGGSAFIGTDVALAAATKQEGYSLGVAAESSTTNYANRLVTPALGGKVILRGTVGDDNASLSSTTTIADTNSYNLRSSDLIESVRGEVKSDSVKLFVTTEVAQSSLNQTNAIFQDFLPNPQQYLRGTIIPGVSYSSDKFELGTSVNLSVRRYSPELDDFGFRRDNERIEPFLFAKYASEEFSAFGSVSRLIGRWHDADFSNVDRTLFDASVAWRPKPFSIELTATRRAAETTFPISPITIDTALVAKASWQAADTWKLSSAVGYAASEYLDSPFRSQTRTYGVGLAHDLPENFAVGLDLTYARGTLISGERAGAVIVTTSLSKRFSPFAKAEKPGAADTTEKKGS
jgi:hypothetical protein